MTNHSENRLFRRVLAAAMVVYAAVAVVLTVVEAPPPRPLAPKPVRIAQLLVSEEELARQRAQEARKKVEQERLKQEAEARRKVAEEAKRKAEAERLKQEAEARKQREAEAARKKAEDEARKKAAEEARKKAEAELLKRDAAARQKADEAARLEAERQRVEAEKRRIEEERRRQEELKHQSEARKQAEIARQKADAAARQEQERQRVAAEKRRVEDARRQADVARQQAVEAERRRQEEARRQAEIARVRAFVAEQQRRAEELRRNQEAAMSAGIMGALDDDEGLDDFLQKDGGAPLVKGSKGNLLGGAAAVTAEQAKRGVDTAALARIEELLADIQDLEGFEAVLGAGGALGEAASTEEIQGFLEDVAAGRVSAGEFVARATTIVENPFKILGEAGGVHVRHAEDITRVIMAHRGELTHFYDKALVRTPGLSGVVTVRMVIGANGRVRSATVERSTTGAKGFDAALIQRILAWDFPPVPAGDVEGLYPFRFSEGL
ncbi:MAG: TonB family protein [Nitrospirae bacterium]|nr:TonB family protein [Nitrospirota bacterium]